MDKEHIVIGSRRSKLALWQTHHVIGLLEQAYPGITTEVKIISTRGDEVLDKSLPMIGGKGVFTEALESALLASEVDIAVHSLKDLPTIDASGLTVGAVPKRADVRDVLISRDGHTLDTLPQAAVIGTSSLRRSSQLLARRPDIKTIDIRGNVPTRIEKAQDPAGPYDAILLANAGVTRLGLTAHVSEAIPTEVMLPAPGQGAMGVQCRDEAASLAMLSVINDVNAQVTAMAERAFLRTLQAGCSAPVAAHAMWADGTLKLSGRLLQVDGSSVIEVEQAIALAHDDVDAPTRGDALGVALAQAAFEQGASAILGTIR